MTATRYQYAQMQNLQGEKWLKSSSKRLGTLSKIKECRYGQQQRVCRKEANEKYAVIPPPHSPSNQERGKYTPAPHQADGPQSLSSNVRASCPPEKSQEGLGKGMPDSSREPCCDCFKEVTILPGKEV